MRVLVSEASAGDAAEVVQRLRTAGHSVLTCRGGPRCPLALGELCPLADSAIDVLVHVRGRPHPFTEHDRPLLCAVIAAVPTVLCGPVPDHGRGPWPRADAWCQPTGVVSAVATATRLTSRTARRRIERAVVDVLRPHGLTAPHHIEVSTRGRLVDVQLLFQERVPVGVREQLRAAIRASLTTLTPQWPYTRVQVNDGIPADADELEDATP